MLAILYDGVDITDNVSKNSVQITEQLNNRANTAAFSVFGEKVEEGHVVEIWEYCTLREAFTSGGVVLQVSDTFSISNKFVTGTVGFVSFDTTSKTRVFVASVDHNNREITLQNTLDVNLPVGTKFGKLVFSGVVQNAPETEMTR